MATVAFAQQSPSLTKYLGLTSAQAVQIQQANATLDQFVHEKQSRLGVLYNQVGAEDSKASPDPLVLGQAYLEIDAISRAIETNTAATKSAIAALLTSTQMQLLQQISDAIIQSSLITDAGCAFLADSPAVSQPTSQALFGFSGSAFASFLLGEIVPAFCPAVFPISIRNYLALTDSEVAGILALQSGYNSFVVQKNNRIADIQVELRDELGKPSLDPLALGVRYIELAEISQELTNTNLTARSNAKALLSPSQRAKLQSLLETSSLLAYQTPATNCRLLSSPPGASSGAFTVYIPSGTSCVLN